MTKIDTVLLTICRLTIGGVVLAAPWYFGGVLPETQVLLQYGVLAAVVVLSLRFLATRSQTLATTSSRIPIGLLPIFGFLLLGVAQVTLPAFGQHGPQGDVSDGIALPAIQPPQLSVYPRATTIETVRLAAIASVCVVVVCCFSTAGSQQFLYTAIALNGMALSFFGIVQRLSWNGKLFWSVELTQGGTPFASYVNRNNAAGYLVMALACAVGMLCAATKDMKFGGSGFVNRTRQVIGQLNERLLLAVLACSVIFVGVLFSLSRSGLISAVSAILVTLAFISKGKSRLQIVIGSGVVLLVLGVCYTLINWLDPSRELESRFREIVIDDVSANGRIKHWLVAIETGFDHLWTGTGLGTHRYSHLAYRQQLFEHWAVNADNQFVELFVDAGLAGVSLVVAEIALLWFAIKRVSATSGGSDPIAVVAIFALTSQLAIGVFDFGISLPANAMTAASIFGMLVARDLNQQLAYRRGGLPGMMVMVLLMVGLSWVCLTKLKTTATAVQSRQNVDRLLSSGEPWNESANETDRLIKDATSALSIDGDNAELHTSLARLWVERYRQKAYVKLDASESEDRFTPEMIWDGTSPTILHRIASRERLAGRNTTIESIRAMPEISNNLTNAVRHFRLASEACKVLPYVDVDIARLSIVAEKQADTSAERLLAAVARSPGDLSILYSVGLIACHEEQDAICFAVWKRYAELFPNAANKGTVHNRNMETMFSALCERFSTDEIIDRVMPNNGKFYPRFLTTSVAQLRFKDCLPQIDQKMLSGLDAEPKPDSGEWHLLRASALAKLERPDEAIAAYRLSFSVEDDLVDRRLKLVRYLESIGRLDEAYDEATICQQLNPDRKDIAELVLKLRKGRHR